MQAAEAKMSGMVCSTAQTFVESSSMAVAATQQSASSRGFAVATLQQCVQMPDVRAAHGQQSQAARGTANYFNLLLAACCTSGIHLGSSPSSLQPRAASSAFASRPGCRRRHPNSPWAAAGGRSSAGHCRMSLATVQAAMTMLS